MDTLENRPEVTDSLELARRINSSTDIVTDLTDVVQEELPKKALQGNNDEATNTAILDAINNIVIDMQPVIDEIDTSTSTVMSGITGLSQKIDNIDFTPVEEKLEEIEGELVQGVTGIFQGVAEIKELVQGVTGFAQEETLVQGLSGLNEKLDILTGYFDDVTYENVMEELNSSEDDA